MEEKVIFFRGQKYKETPVEGSACGECDLLGYRVTEVAKFCVVCKTDTVFKEVNSPEQVLHNVENTEGVKYDSDKIQYSLIPPYALESVAKNLTAGLKKYPGRDNWKLVDNAKERYLDALYRHLEAHRKGEFIDSESSVENMPHLAAVIANAMFLLEFELNPELKNKE